MKKILAAALLLIPCLARADVLRVINSPDGRKQYIHRLSSISIGDLGMGVQILDEGVLQGGATWFNFTGSGCTASASGGTATINCSGGGGGGGGASSLAVGRGSVQAFIQVSSPTSHISFSTGDFNVSLLDSTTAFLRLDFTRLLGSSPTWTSSPVFAASITATSIFVDPSNTQAGTIILGIGGTSVGLGRGSNGTAIMSGATTLAEFTTTGINANKNIYFPIGGLGGEPTADVSWIGKTDHGLFSRWDSTTFRYFGMTVGGSEYIRFRSPGVSIGKKDASASLSISSMPALPNRPLVEVSSGLRQFEVTGNSVTAGVELFSGEASINVFMATATLAIAGAGGGGAQFGYISTRSISMGGLYAISNSTEIEIGAARVSVFMATVSIVNNTQNSTMTTIEKHLGTYTSTTPYTSFSIPAGAFVGMGDSSGSWTNGGFAISSTGPMGLVPFNRMRRSFHEMRKDTYSFVYTDIQMPYNWDGSSIGIQFWAWGSSGTANTNMVLAFGAIGISSGASAYPLVTDVSSTSIVMTYKAADQMIYSPVRPLNIPNAISGQVISSFVTRVGDSGRDTFDGFTRFGGVTIFYRKSGLEDVGSQEGGLGD